MDKSKINDHFLTFDIDYLYHLGLDTSMDLAAQFSDVKYVIFTLSNAEAKVIANEFAKNIYQIQGESFSYKPIYKTERFHMYKVDASIIISIGVGMPSLLICINEITKLLVHLEKYDVTFLKVGFSGGVGINDGDIVISNKVVNAKFENLYESVECGELYQYNTVFDDKLAKEFLEFSNAHASYCNTILGINLSTHDFYDEQARMHGAIAPDFTQEEATQYLKKAHSIGIRSIDMESLAFAGFCNQLNIPGCVIGVSVVDRLLKEDISCTMDEQLKNLSKLANTLARFIKSKLGALKS